MARVIHNPLSSFTATTSTAPDSQGILGRLFDDDNGAVYRFIKATGGALTNKLAVQPDASEGNAYSVESCSAGNPPCGVAVAAVSTNSYGFVQVGGVATCLTAASGGSATANELVSVLGSAGKLQPAAVAATGNNAANLVSALGIALAAKTANQSVSVLLKGLY